MYSSMRGCCLMLFCLWALLVSAQHDIAPEIDNLDSFDLLTSELEGEAVYCWYVVSGTETVMAEGRLLDGLKEGWWSYYYLNGQTKSVGRYMRNKKTGYWKMFYEDGVVWMEGFYQDDFRSDFWQTYAPDKRLKSAGWYHLGRFDGWWKYYSNEGLVEEGQYVDGEKIGYWKTYENGALESLMNYD